MKNLRNRIYLLLRKSESLFKTDMIYLVKGGSLLSIGQVATAITSFSLSVVFANLLPQSSYGMYRYVISLAATLTAFSLTGIGTAVVQSTAKGYEGVLQSSFWISLRWSLLMVIISLIGAGYYLIHGNTILASSLIFIAAFSPFLNSAHVATYYASGKKDFTRLSIYNIIKGIIPALFVIATIFITKNILFILFIYFLANTLIGLLTYINALKIYNPSKIDDPHLLDYSKKLSILNVLGTVTAHADKLLIFTYLGALDLAIYGIAIAFPEQIRALFRNLNLLMVPKLSEKKGVVTNLYLQKKVFILLLVLVCITGIYIVLAPVLFKIFFPKYLIAIHYSMIYGLSIITRLAWVPYSVLIANKHDKELFQINTLGSVFQLLLLFSFIYVWGLWGVIIAKTVNSFTNMMLYFIYVRKNYKL